VSVGVRSCMFASKLREEFRSNLILVIYIKRYRHVLILVRIVKT